MNRRPLLEQLSFSAEEIRALSLPAMALTGLVLVALLFEAGMAFSAGELQHGWRLVALAVFGSAYAGLLYRYVGRVSPRRRMLRWLGAAAHGALIPLVAALLWPAEMVYYVLSAATLVFMAVAFGEMPTLLFLVANVLVGMFWFYPRVQPPYPLLVYFLQLTLVAFGIAATALHARRMLLLRMRNLRILNQVARALALSIDRDQVVALVKEAIQQSLQADTYYLALLGDERLQVELLYDEGAFFPSMTLPREGGLAGWVLEHRRTLRLNNVPLELPLLGVQHRLVGKPRVNLSWMGTPLESGGHLLGLVAVGAYRPNAFSSQDQELLENLAQQVALALDNAFHHAEVEEQARRDSLTGAYNHRYFVERLHALCAEARQQGRPLSLIMLDIDHFKSYNDAYGHIVGDEVLRVTVRTIRRYIKRTDVVGRWGGEEFAIALPGASLRQALGVAERIRSTLEHFTLQDREGKLVPAPTVSQGVAEFPAERDEPYALIDLADQRLYLAKEKGRNQIFPPLPEETGV